MQDTWHNTSNKLFLQPRLLEKLGKPILYSSAISNLLSSQTVCSGLSSNDLICFYKCVIRSVVEYGYVVWHHNLTTAQSDRLEALQKWALRIILHPITPPYNTALA